MRVSLQESGSRARRPPGQEGGGPSARDRLCMQSHLRVDERWLQKVERNPRDASLSDTLGFETLHAKAGSRSEEAALPPAARGARQSRGDG
jgi:hypothetical protein